MARGFRLCLPLLARHLADDFPIFDFDQQAVADDAGIVDTAVQSREVGNHLIEGGNDLVLAGHVGRVRAGRDPCRFAGGLRGRHAVGIQIHQGQVGAALSESLGHGGAQAPGGACDNDHLVLEIHDRASHPKKFAARHLTGVPVLSPAGAVRTLA